MGSEADLFNLVGHSFVGKYDVTRTVARGGFGLVYQGVHRTLHKQVAIKVLIVPEEFNDKARTSFMEFFLREAQTIAQLKHPAVVQVLDSGVDAMPSGVTAPWMALEWVDGQTLEEELGARRGRGGRSPEQVLAILHPVLEALAHAHERGIVHRDLKPANMMLPAHTAGQSRLGLPGIQLLDFGIAKVMDANERSGSGATRTTSNRRAFSPSYAAPEQVGGSRTGPWTDVHAMGLILTEVLTDKPPFPARDSTELFIKVLSAHRPTPGAGGVDVGGWEPVIARCLSLMPRERYASAGELLTALEEGLLGEQAGTTPARPATAFEAPTIARTSTPHPLLSSPRERVDPVLNQTTLHALETATTHEAPARRGVKSLALLGVALALFILIPLSYGLVKARSSQAPALPATARSAPHVRPRPGDLVAAAPSPVAAPAPSTAEPSAVQVTAPAPAAPAPAAPASPTPSSATVAARGNPSRGTTSRTVPPRRGNHVAPTRPAVRVLAPPADPPVPQSAPVSATPGLGRGDL